ncbi:MAG: hypothetical protein RI885_1065 [Actinomycetota bacterium]|jgi:hypothetical protein
MSFRFYIRVTAGPRTSLTARRHPWDWGDVYDPTFAAGETAGH